MFDLEQAIAEWRREMKSAGIKTTVPLAELELHLRDEVERQLKLGLPEQRAFDFATRQLGEASRLKNEFQKVRTPNWNRPLAWAAWGTFAISFNLPAYGSCPGWLCAKFSILAFQDTFHDCDSFLLALLTLANLLMIASIFWLPMGSGSARALKWLRGLSFAALALVWSYVGLWLANDGSSYLKVGCYVWCASFLLLCLSTFPLPERKMKKHYI